MNLVLHNKASGEIKSGNTFSNPQYLDNGALKRFDFVVANPPFSLKNWTDGLQEFGRFDGYDDRPKRTATTLGFCTFSSRSSPPARRQ